MTFVSIEPFEPVVLERVWGTETIIASTPAYTAKVLVYLAGKAGGLQYHRRKMESFYLHSGLAWVDHDDGNGKLVRTEMTPGMSFHIPCGAPHRFIAREDCIVFEASVPIENDRVRVEETYGADVWGDEYGLETTPEPEG